MEVTTMIKKIVMILIAVLLVVGISVPAGKEILSATTPTGYRRGEIQRELLYAQGKLYLYADDFMKNLPSGAEEIGTIQKISNQSVPKSEMEASRLEVGLSVYRLNSSEKDQLIVKWSDSRYEVFVPYKGDPNDFLPKK